MGVTGGEVRRRKRHAAWNDFHKGGSNKKGPFKYLKRGEKAKSANFERKKMFYKTENFIFTERKDSSSDQTVY